MSQKPFLARLGLTYFSRRSEALPAAESADENNAWKDLFDAANHSILTEIKGRDE